MIIAEKVKKIDGRSFPSPEKLEALKLAREKAYAIRAEQRVLKDKETLVKQLNLKKRESDVNLKLKELTEVKPVETVEPVNLVEPVKFKIKKKKIIIEDSSSDDEHEVVYRRVKKEIEKDVFTEKHLSQSHINNEMKRLRREMARKSLFKPF